MAVFAKTLTISLSSGRPAFIGRRRGGWIVYLVHVRDYIHNFTMSMTERLCGGGTLTSKHV